MPGLTSDQADNIFQKLEDLHSAILVIQTRCPACTAQIEEHQRKLSGSNGQKGLCTRVTLLEEARGRVGRIALAVIGLVGTVLGAVVMAIGSALASR